jgi:hypothetical protein
MQTKFFYANDYTSTAVDSVGISQGSNQVKVTFKGGSTYLYSNIEGNIIKDVSRGGCKSLGKWVTKYLVNGDADYLQLA